MNTVVPEFGTWVLAQVAGWKESRRGYLNAPLLKDVPLYVWGELESRPHMDGLVPVVGGYDVVPASIRPADPGVSFPRAEWRPVPEATDAAYSWRARLRAHQSWYREFVLALPPGMHAAPNKEPRQVDSRLPHDAVEDEPSLNFLLDDAIAAKAYARLGEKGWGGIINRDRLRRDLLSSQPLCFNLSGFLEGELEALGSILRDVLELDVDNVREVRLEWAPRFPDRKSGSAFDCFIDYEGSRGRGFLGIECKYSEDLLAQRPTSLEENPEYLVETEAAASPFVPGAADELNQPLTCQLWYNTCLALALAERREHTEATVVMMSCREDTLAKQAVEKTKEQLLPERESLVRWCPHEDVIDAEQGFSELDAWATHFRTRYLDLALSSPAVST